MKTFQQFLEARDESERNLSVEPLSNGLLSVFDRKSKSRGNWKYTTKDGKIVVGKYHAGDLGRHPEYGITSAHVQKAVDNL